jgi:hypothetical protein
LKKALTLQMFFKNMDALQQIRKPIEAEMSQYKQVFDSYLVHTNPLLNRVLNTIGNRRGKMMRPMLTLLIAKLVGGGKVDENAIYTAATFEFFHTASLVHDDIVDESEERRGQESVNNAYGNQIAVLVGDFILANALKCASFTGSSRLVNIVSEAAQQLASGELLQLSNVQNDNFSEDVYFDIICGKTADGQPVFEFRWLDETAGWLVCSADYREGRLIISAHQSNTKFALDNALMVLYALATAEKGTALFHAAVVSHQGKGYMFLGPSGTGKSTHARLWLKYIEGAALVNDDNPVVRVEGEQAVVYGSPWSGKTPCYRNVSYPLGAIVLLSQAPYNKIRRLSGIHAYVALIESISGKRWDERIADGLHRTEDALVAQVPVWHLECLPDEEAARLCQLNIKR